MKSAHASHVIGSAVGIARLRLLSLLMPEMWRSSTKYELGRDSGPEDLSLAQAETARFDQSSTILIGEDTLFITDLYTGMGNNIYLTSHVLAPLFFSLEHNESKHHNHNLQKDNEQFSFHSSAIPCECQNVRSIPTSCCHSSLSAAPKTTHD